MSIRVLGWYHILGSVLGAAMSIWLIASGGAPVGGSLLASTAPFGLCWIAGLKLLQGRRQGASYAYLAQLLQVPIIVLPAFTWKFVGGAIASVSLTLGGTRLYAGLEATWFVGRGDSAVLEPAIGINFAPIIVMWLLSRSRVRAREPLDAATVS